MAILPPPETVGPRAARRLLAPRTRRHLWRPDARQHQSTTLRNVGLTLGNPLELPGTVTHFRVWLANDAMNGTPGTGNPFTIDAMGYATSSVYPTANANAVNEVGGNVTPAAVTFNSLGVPNDNIFSQPAGSTTSITVPPGTGSTSPTSRVNLMCSDWMPVTPLARTDGGNGTVLILRTYSVAGFRAVLLAPTSANWANPLFHRGFRRGAYTAAGNLTNVATTVNSPVQDLGYWAIEYLTREYGYSIVTGGDSLSMGRDSAGGTGWDNSQAASYVHALTLAAQNPNIPISYANIGVSGSTTVDFMANLDTLLTTMCAGGEKTWVGVPVFSRNDMTNIGTTNAVAEAGERRALAFAYKAALQARGDMVALMTPYPDATYGGNAGRLALTERMTSAAMSAGWPLIRADRALGDSAGAFLSGAYATDGVHLSDAGRDVLQAEIARVINPCLLLS